MSLSTNFDISANSGPVLMDFSPDYRSYIFLLLCMPDNLYWMPCIVNFILLGAGYFCTSINILEFCSASPIIYLEIV